MFGNDRAAMRKVFTEAWRRRLAGEPLDALQQMISEVVAQHPEYHRLIEQPESALQHEFHPDQGQSNPFLHMGMHISLLEQVATDRPAGIAATHSRLSRKVGDTHEAEHQMMECLGLMLWQAQRAGTMPDEKAYLECLQRLPAGAAK